MKKKLVFLPLLITLLIMGCYTSGSKTTKKAGSNQIVYKPVAESLNDSAKTLLRQLILDKDYSTNPIVRRSLHCGPYLWRKLKDLETFQDIKGAQVVTMVGDTMLESKVLWEDKVHSLLDYAFKGVQANELRIRKLNEDEIRVYWAYICFDIEEPIFMAETGKNKYVVDFVKDTLRLFWFDDFTSLGVDHSDFEHVPTEPINTLDLPVGIFDLSLEYHTNIPDSVFVLLPFLGGNLFFTDRPSSNVHELMVSSNSRVQIPLDTLIFQGKDGPGTKNELFEQLELRISPEDTRFGRFGSYCGRYDKGKMDDFGEMIMFWNNSKKDGFLLCYFDRPCKVEGFIAQKSLVIDIVIEKPGFYCIGNEQLPDGKTFMKEVNPPAEGFYFIGIAKERQKW